MSFTREESGQLGPFEELYELIVVVTLLFMFSAAVARSYSEYENKAASVGRFSAGLDFSWLLRNSLLAFEVNGVPNPGLLSDSVLVKNGNYVYINHFWGKPYEWEVLIRGMDGAMLYEFGSLNKDSYDPKAPQTKIEKLMMDPNVDITLVNSPIALRRSDGTTEFARMEVWVW